MIEPASVQEFGPATIDEYLLTTEFHPLSDADGNRLIRFEYSEDWGCALDVWLKILGSRREVYGVQVRSDRRFTIGEWDSVRLACNEWNVDNMWPCASLYLPEGTEAKHGSILLDNYVSFETGVHVGLLKDFTDSVIGSAFGFWKWLQARESA